MMPIMAQVFSILSTGRWPLAETQLILWRRGRHDARWGGAAIFETTRTPRHRAGGDPPCILWERRHRRDFRADANTTASPRVPGGHKGGAPTIFGRSEHRAPHATPPVGAAPPPRLRTVANTTASGRGRPSYKPLPVGAAPPPRLRTVANTTASGRGRPSVVVAALSGGVSRGTTA